MEAIRKEEVDKLYQLYVSIYPHMDPDSRISFEDLEKEVFNKSRATATNNKKSKEDIMKEVEVIIGNIRGGEHY